MKNSSFSLIIASVGLVLMLFALYNIEDFKAFTFSNYSQVLVGFLVMLSMLINYKKQKKQESKD